MRPMIHRCLGFMLVLAAAVFGAGTVLASAITRRSSQAEYNGPQNGRIDVATYSNVAVARKKMADLDFVGAVFGMSLKPEDYKDLSSNWLECDGREVSCADYPKLAALLNSGAGADGKPKSFRLPDLRGLATMFPTPPAVGPGTTAIVMDQLYLKQAREGDFQRQPPEAREVRWLVRAR